MAIRNLRRARGEAITVMLGAAALVGAGGPVQADAITSGSKVATDTVADPTSVGMATPYIVTDPNPGGHTWSDCLYPNRTLASSTVIAKFSYSSGKAAGSYVLDYKQVRHIKDSHGFNSNTESLHQPRAGEGAAQGNLEDRFKQ